MISFTKVRRSRRKRSDNMLLFVNMARKAGMPLSRQPIEGPGSRALHWDGTDCAYKGDTLSNALHELAHWMVADPERREVPNFGLGSSPSDNAPWSDDEAMGEFHRANERVVPEPEEEEMDASVLGICYEYHLGLDAASTLESHSWDNGFSGEAAKFTSRVRDLIKRGFLTRDGVPILEQHHA